MARRTKFRSAFAAGVFGLALIAAGCSSNNDPGTWAEAEEDGTVRENFLRSCNESNTEGGDMAVSDAADYCECTYLSLIEHFSDDFEGFKDAEKRLRNDPNDIDRELVVLFEGCASSVG